MKVTGDGVELEQDEYLWVGVRKFSVHIVQKLDGLAINVYSQSLEMEDPLQSIRLFDVDAEKEV